MIPPATGGTDDPNSSTLNPNEHGKMGTGKDYADKSFPVVRGCCAAVAHPLMAGASQGGSAAAIDYFGVDFSPRGYLY